MKFIRGPWYYSIGRPIVALAVLTIVVLIFR